MRAFSHVSSLTLFSDLSFFRSPVHRVGLLVSLDDPVWSKAVIKLTRSGAGVITN